MTYDPDNVFARILRGELPCHKVFEDADTLAILDIHPRADGHVLVMPKTPARNILDAAPAQLAACMATAQRVARALMTALGADGISLRQSNESAGDQDVFHLHFHLLPRHAGTPLRAADGPVANPAELSAIAEKIRIALAQDAEAGGVRKEN